MNRIFTVIAMTSVMLVGAFAVCCLFRKSVDDEQAPANCANGRMHEEANVC